MEAVFKDVRGERRESERRDEPEIHRSGDATEADIQRKRLGDFAGERAIGK